MLSVATRLERGSAGEDRLVVERLDHETIVVVADGAGGTGSGGLAAELFCSRAIEMLRQPSSEPMARYETLFLDGDRFLFETAGGGEAAAVLLVISERDATIRGASVGDAGAWSITGSNIVDLTERQIRKPLLGSGKAVPTTFGPTPFGDRLLVATDGLFNYASVAEITARARQGALEEAAASLLAAVRLRSGKLPDDVALVLCERIP